MNETLGIRQNDPDLVVGMPNIIIDTDEENLVQDGRGSLSPSQHVEQKLLRVLNTSPVMISQINRRMKPGPR